MNDRISLTGIEVTATHGALPHEKTDPQKFVIDLELWLDLSLAALADDLAKTVDYGFIANETYGLVESTSFDLIETLAERIAKMVLSVEMVEQVAVTVHKPEAPIEVPFADVAVSITRRR